MEPKRITVLFESIEGHTVTVARKLSECLAARGFAARAVRCRDACPEDLTADALVLGSSIHAGHQNARAVKFVKANLDAFQKKPAAQFLVCLTARSQKPEHQAIVEGYQRDFVSRTGWQPALRRVFAGALLYTRYGFLKRRIMASILRKEGGDTDTSKDYIYTDWASVEAFAGEIAQLAGG